MDAVCERHPWLDPHAVRALAGVNFLTWAGYFLAGHPNPDATHDDAGRFMDLARRLLA